MEQEIKQSTATFVYKLGDLAKLDNAHNLGITLLKPRNPNAQRGSCFEILLANKTNLIVRREWVKKKRDTYYHT